MGVVWGLRCEGVETQELWAEGEGLRIEGGTAQGAGLGVLYAIKCCAGLR